MNKKELVLRAIHRNPELFKTGEKRAYASKFFTPHNNAIYFPKKFKR